ncbi:hypothetical protein TNCV_947791 [Trichonephila clavipes]|nr:hypothetical protein TNCV_947791 [Trichonephila clavipes]
MPNLRNGKRKRKTKKRRGPLHVFGAEPRGFLLSLRIVMQKQQTMLFPRDRHGRAEKRDCRVFSFRSLRYLEHN